MLTRIDHVGIACRDLAATIAFYESTFGLTVVSKETNTEQGVREAMLAVGETPRPARPTSSCSSRCTRHAGRASSSSGAARACTTSGTAWPTSKTRWRPSARPGVRLLDAGPGTARWAPRSPSCTPLISAACSLNSSSLPQITADKPPGTEVRQQQSRTNRTWCAGSSKGGQAELIRELGHEQPRTRLQRRDTGVRCQAPGNVNWPAGAGPRGPGAAGEPGKQARRTAPGTDIPDRQAQRCNKPTPATQD